MGSSERLLNPSDAARRLGVSVKALRLYETRGLLRPQRTLAGWRAYDTVDMDRALRIKTFRALGFGLARIERLLDGDARDLALALAAQQTLMAGRMRELADVVDRIGRLRDDLRSDPRPAARSDALDVAFELPWPWGGEAFRLRDIGRLTYITGPLGSGKTRLAMRLAERLPNAAFLGLDRLAEGGAGARRRLAHDPNLESRVDGVLARLLADGATGSDALTALVVALEEEDHATLVIDMVEQGLDARTQDALIASLRRRGVEGKRLFLMTRSCVILDLDTVGADETIILCPANHGPPLRVSPCRGTPGYEAVATCLATPDVRSRTAGVTAARCMA